MGRDCSTEQTERKKQLSMPEYDCSVNRPAIGKPCDYAITHKLGSGFFGEVFAAVSVNTGEQVALKKIDKRRNHFDVRIVAREIFAGNQLHHPGIVEYKGFFETENNFYLVLELINGLDLHGFMEKRGFRPLTEDEVRSIMKQLVDILLFCHKQGICHRDIKWENILLQQDGTVKLIDFGLSVHAKPSDLCTDWVGSPNFVAPEVNAAKLEKMPYSPFKADVFSLGVVFYGLMFGSLSIESVPEGDFSTIRWPDKTMSCFPNFVSRAAKDLMAQMLNPDYCSRVSLEEISNHRWFRL